MAATATSPYAHLLTLTDATGVLEHADGAIARREHGCLDDNAGRGPAGHLSVVPVQGRTEAHSPPGFDQQPVEVVSLAEAAAVAHATTGDPQWLGRLDASFAWFGGANDGGVTMVDAATGGGLDGLTPQGPNRNQGAESTLAWMATWQLAQRLLPARTGDSSKVSSNTAAST